MKLVSNKNAIFAWKRKYKEKMKLDRLQLRNYRNYKDFSVDFGSEVTIFIGKNGSGKTNMIKAVKQLLSFVFSGPINKIGRASCRERV